jgi:drug/metabolite transporter (DMT)-like permease
LSGRDLGALLLLGVLWGGSFIFVRVAAPVLGPFVLMELRVGLAALALGLYAVAWGRAPKLRGRWREFVVLGALNAAVPFTLIGAAAIELTASLLAILNSTTTLFAALVAAAWLGESLTVRKALGIAVGIVGVAGLVGWDSVPLSGAVLLAVGGSLLAALSYALAGVYARQTFAGSPPLALAIGQQVAAAALLLPLAAADLPQQAPPVGVVASVLGLALLSTAVAYLLYFRLIENVGPTSTLTVTFLVPVFGVLFGVVLLGEPFGVGTLAGMGVVLAGVALVTEVGRRPG